MDLPGRAGDRLRHVARCRVIVQPIQREVDRLTGEEGGGERLSRGLGFFGAAHDRQERRPVERLAPLKLQGLGFAEAWAVAGPEGEAAVVEASATRAAEHLQEFVRADLPFGVIGRITSVGHQHRAEREVDARGQSGRGHDHAQLARLGPRFDEFGPLFESEPAVVEPDPLAEESIEVIAREAALAGGELGAVAQGQAGRDVPGDLLGGSAAGGEDQDRTQVGEDGPDDRAGDMAFDAGRLAGLQGVEGDLLERDRAGVLLDQRDLAAAAAEPFGHGLGVGDAAAEEQELGGGWGDGQDGFVGRPATGVGQHLVLIDHQQVRVAAFEEPMALCLQGRHDDRGAEVGADVPGRDAHVPAEGEPFGPLVVGQGPGRHRVDRLAAVAAADEQFEDVGLAGARRGLDDDVLALPEGAEGVLLPEVGEGEPRVRHGEFPSNGGRAEKQAEGVCGCGFSDPRATTLVAWPSATTSPAGLRKSTRTSTS